MIKFTDFIKAPDAARTKVKFNMNGGDRNKPAWDFLLEDSPDWLGMNSYKTKQPSNNLNHADYLIALAVGAYFAGIVAGVCRFFIRFLSNITVRLDLTITVVAQFNINDLAD